MENGAPAGRRLGEGWSLLRWFVVVLPVVVLFLGGLSSDRLLEAVGVLPMRPVFSDTIAILAAGEAHAAGMDVYKPNPLDPFNRPHVYGSWWLATGRLGLVRADSWWIGALLAAGFIASAAVVLSPRSAAGMAIAAAMLASPGVILALQRGNNDLVIFLLLVAAAALVARRQIAFGAAAGGLVALAMALKVYPLASLPMLAARPGPRRKALALAAIAAVGCAVLLVRLWNDFSRVRQMAPDALSIYSYGARLGYSMLATMPAERGWILAGALPILALGAILAWLRWGSVVGAVPESGFTAACYVGGAASWLFCYVTTMNFPYRLILFLLPARLWLEQGFPAIRPSSSAVEPPAARHRLTAAANAIGCAVFLWLSVFKDMLLVTKDDQIVTGSPVTWIVIGVEQALAFVLSAGFAISLLAWARRTWTGGIKDL